MFLVLFDIEAISLGSWAVRLQSLNLIPLIVIVIFILIPWWNISLEERRVGREAIYRRWEANIITMSLYNVVNWMRKTALWPMIFCAIEMIAMVLSHYDLDRFGAGFLHSVQNRGRLGDLGRSRVLNHKSLNDCKKALEKKGQEQGITTKSVSPFSRNF